MAEARHRPARSDPPGPEHPERLAAPLHLHAAAAALFDGLPGPLADGDVGAAVDALDRGRAELAERAPAGTELTVDGYRVRQAAVCAASAAPDEAEFGWAPATAARYLGLRAVALHLCGGEELPVERAIDAVVGELLRGGVERTPGPWLRDLDPAGRAVAQAHARRWAEQALAWVPLRLVEPGALRFLDDDWWPGGRSVRTLRLHGRRDITVDVAGPDVPRRAARRVAVVLYGGTARTPGSADADAFTALAATLCDPRARVVRIVRVHPASGEVVATDVTPELLRRGVQVALATAAALLPGGARPTPGEACRWCPHQAGCAPGTTWLGRPDRRSMGLPVGAVPPIAAKTTTPEPRQRGRPAPSLTPQSTSGSRRGEEWGTAR